MIKLWINKKSWELDNWNALVKKAIKLKAKARIQVLASRNINQCYFQDNQLINTILAKVFHEKYYKKVQVKLVENFSSIK